MRAGTIAKSVLVVAVLAMVVSACGRRPGTLDTPYEAAVEERRQAEREGVEPLPPQPERPVRDRPFILDSLI
jgi:predicted small lipoprotein YifL